MTSVEQQLLRRILVSPQFAQANALQRILQYLCEQTSHDESSSVKEYQIAVEALGRQPSFDPKTDPIVRVSVASIRERLKAYFENDGAREPLRLSVPKGSYRASFTPAGPASLSSKNDAPRSSALRKFWGAHLNSGNPNVLVFTELLFFRDANGNYLRNIFVNRLPDGAREIGEKIPLSLPAELRPSYHFLSAGEVYSMLSIMRLFASLDAPLDLRNARFCSWNDLQHSSLVLLGSARTNAFSDSLQSGGDFIITDDHIENRSPAPGESPVYAGRRYMEGKLERLTEYALVTRRPGLRPGTFITMIAANHGRAVEGAGQFLALEDKVEELLARTGFDTLRELPERFQILLRVEMIDFDEEVIQVDYAAHRVESA